MLMSSLPFTRTFRPFASSVAVPRRPQRLGRVSSAAELFLGNREPTLAELLDDPLTRAVYRRDGLSVAQVAALMADARKRLADAAQSVSLPDRPL